MWDLAGGDWVVDRVPAINDGWALRVEQLFEGDRLVAAGAGPSGAYSSHEGSALASLLAKQACRPPRRLLLDK